MTKNIKIRTLIIFSTGILLVSMLLMGGLSIYYTNSISHNTETLYNRPHTNLVKMWQVKTEVMAVGQALRESVLSDGAAGVAQADVDHVPALLNEIEANKVDPTAPVSDNMKAILNAVDAWSASAMAVSRSAGGTDSIRTLKEYSALEQDVLDKMNSIIKTASDNALLFKNNSTKQAAQSIIILIVLFAACLVLSVLVLLSVLSRISAPISILLKAADRLAEGDLEAEIAFHSKNEFGALADRFRNMQDRLKHIIYDIDRMLDCMGKGDFTLSCGADYMGDFSSIRESLDRICRSLSSELGKINISAQEVSSGANEVAGGAQALAQGATEQASSVEELAATIAEISQRIENTAKHTLDAKDNMHTAEQQTQNSMNEMEKMTGAMAEINDRASKIGAIIKTIEDIAFQTNILALNAAVEAARAGSAGKGFAVVADEVRNLAGKSSEAAKSTTELIMGTVESVNNGTAVAKRASASLLQVVSTSEKIGMIVERISEDSSSEAEAVRQVATGIDQISAVVQNNSATAEESAAASEELSGQSQILKQVAGRFRLLREDAISAAPPEKDPCPVPLQSGRTSMDKY